MMKSELKVPKGWRVLKKGTVIKEGDKFDSVGWWDTGAIGKRVGQKIGGVASGCYIREKPSTKQNQNGNKPNT